MPFFTALPFLAYYIAIILLTLLGVTLLKTSLWIGLVLTIIWLFVILLVSVKLKIPVENKSPWDKTLYIIKRSSWYTLPLQIIILITFFTNEALMVQTNYFPTSSGTASFDDNLYMACSVGVQVASFMAGIVVAYNLCMPILDRLKGESKNVAGPFIFLLGSIIFALVMYLPYWVLSLLDPTLRRFGGEGFFWGSFVVYSLLSFPLIEWFERNLLSAQWSFSPRRRRY
jgi:hypothetical protein